MVEYALLAGFLAAAGGAILSTSGDNVKTVYADVAVTLEAAVTDSGTPAADSPAPSDNPSDPGDGSGDGGGKKPKKPKKPKKSK
jgi:Flp pilus assembly pilin Flp